MFKLIRAFLKEIPKSSLNSPHRIVLVLVIAGGLFLSGCLATLSEKFSGNPGWEPLRGASDSCRYWANYKGKKNTDTDKKTPKTESQNSAQEKCDNSNLPQKNYSDLKEVAKEAVEVRPRWSRMPEGDRWTEVATATMEAEAKTAPNRPAKPIWDLEPKDIGRFCPNYKNLDTEARKKFWLFFFSTMTETESDNCPTSNSSGNLGLFQFELEDLHSAPWIQHFRCANVRTKEQAFNPETNMKCGIQGVISLIRRDNLIGGVPSEGTFDKGAAAFWGVLRYDRAHQGDNRARIDAWCAKYTPCIKATK